jgi:hypothetical protein
VIKPKPIKLNLIANKKEKANSESRVEEATNSATATAAKSGKLSIRLSDDDDELNNAMLNMLNNNQQSPHVLNSAGGSTN